MTWTKLDDAFWSNPKVIAAGNDGAGVYARMLSYCADHLTDGKIPEDIARFIARRGKVLERLIDVGLIAVNGSGYVIPDYLDFNPTAEQEKAKQKARRMAGKRGGLATAAGRSKP